jgi:hypothetical protein
MRGGLLRTLVLLMALIAMSLRAALPAGYMFADSDGRVVVSLCNGGSMTLDLGKSEHSKQAHHDAPCPYASAAHAATAPSQALALALPTHVVVASGEAKARPGRGLAAPPPPATGPPTLS